MRNLLKNKRGITLVELIVALALVVVVMIPLSSFFITNYKYLYKANKEIEAQRQAEKSMNNLSDVLINTKAALDRSYIGNNSSLSIERIVFSLMDGSFVVLQYMDTNSDGRRDSINAKETSDIDYIIQATEISETIKAKNVDYFNVILKPDDSIIVNSNIAVLTITVSDSGEAEGDETVTVSSEIYMRNFNK